MADQRMTEASGSGLCIFADMDAPMLSQVEAPMLPSLLGHHLQYMLELIESFTNLRIDGQLVSFREGSHYLLDIGKEALRRDKQ